jgi:energy-coupling factor transporter ATP-binding protein EcfA2
MDNREPQSFIAPNPYNLRPNQRTKFNYDKPTIIITAGPTGSGKSSLLNKALNLLYKDSQPPTYKSFLIDDYVENSQNYKAMIDTVIDKFGCNQSIAPDSPCDVVNPNQELVDDLVQAYFEIRENGPCDSSGKSCKELFNVELRTAIENRENILIETTGKEIPLKYINRIAEFAGLTNYNFLFMYSILDFVPLLERVKSRFKKSMISYLNDKNGPAPRIPDTSVETFKKKTSKIITTLIKLRNVCLRLGRPRDPECGVINSNGNFILLIFDNNKMPSKLIYDSRTSHNLMTDGEFITLLHSYGLEGGSLNRSKRIKKRKTLRRKTLRRKTLRRKTNKK